MSVRHAVKLAALAGVATLALTGCHFVGGGTVPSKTGTGSAVFGFDLRCKPGTTVQSGTITYLDKPAGVQVRGVVARTSAPDPCYTNQQATDSSGQATGWFNGTYTQLNGHGSGTFSLSVTTGNSVLTPGSATFDIELNGGPLDGYENSGPLTLGEIRTIGGPNA